MNSGMSTNHRSKSARGRASTRAAAIRAAAERLETRRLLATFTVTTIADVVDPSDGINTLREAIIESNTIPGVDRIEFNLPGPGPHIISPTGMLPSIVTGCILDGRTQPGYAG